MRRLNSSCWVQADTFQVLYGNTNAIDAILDVRCIDHKTFLETSSSCQQFSRRQRLEGSISSYARIDRLQPTICALFFRPKHNIHDLWSCQEELRRKIAR